MLYHVHIRAYSTLPVILAAISHFHCRFYLPSPTTSRSITRSLEGAKRLFGSPSTSRKIITKSILDSLFALTSRRNISFVLLRTVWRIFIEFYGLLRFSEVSNLTFSDLTWTDLGFDLFIAKSKTDQHRKGDWVSIAATGCQSQLNRVPRVVLLPSLAVTSLFYLTTPASLCLPSKNQFLTLLLL